jgi:D-galactarolactone cycloisomerase
MAIHSVEVVNLHFEYPGEGFRCAEGRTNARLTSLVVITCEDGLTGIGSAYTHPDLMRVIVEQHLAPFLIGADPAATEQLWHDMYGLTRWYGRKGAAMSAIGAVDIALWDIRAKQRQEPLYRLLGGSRPEVEAYASALLWADDLAVLRAEASRHAEDGFRTMKMRLGRDPDYDRAAVAAVTSVIGPGRRVAVDGTHRYSLEQATEFAVFLAGHDVAWFEEPFPPEDIGRYAALRQTGRIPVAAGENEFGVQGFAELLRCGAIDIAQPDASRTGGITEALRIGELAAAQGVPVITHTWNDAVALLANAHVVSALANGQMVEVDRTGNPFIDSLGVSPLHFDDGRLRLPDAPGLGIELDPEVIARYRVPAGDQVADGNYADLVFGRKYLPRAP